MVPFAQDVWLAGLKVEPPCADALDVLLLHVRGDNDWNELLLKARTPLGYLVAPVDYEARRADDRGRLDDLVTRVGAEAAVEEGVDDRDRLERLAQPLPMQREASPVAL